MYCFMHNNWFCVRCTKNDTLRTTMHMNILVSLIWFQFVQQHQQVSFNWSFRFHIITEITMIWTIGCIVNREKEKTHYQVSTLTTEIERNIIFVTGLRIYKEFHFFSIFSLKKRIFLLYLFIWETTFPFIWKITYLFHKKSLFFRRYTP